MKGRDEGTVDCRPTYNGEDEEPEIMPGLFPNLLANGAGGIAVGMATNIPPHNAAEVIDAALLLIAHPQAALAPLLAPLKGPDHTTCGIIISKPSTIPHPYATGRDGYPGTARIPHGPERQER